MTLEQEVSPWMIPTSCRRKTWDRTLQRYTTTCVVAVPRPDCPVQQFRQVDARRGPNSAAVYRTLPKHQGSG